MVDNLREDYSELGIHGPGRGYQEIEAKIEEGSRGIKPVIASIVERTDWIHESKYHHHDLHNLVLLTNLAYAESNGESISEANYIQQITGSYSPEISFAFEDMVQKNPSKPVPTRQQEDTGRFKPGKGLLEAEPDIDSDIDEFIDSIWANVKEKDGFLIGRRKIEARNVIGDTGLYDISLDEQPKPLTVEELV